MLSSRLMMSCYTIKAYCTNNDYHVVPRRILIALVRSCTVIFYLGNCVYDNLYQYLFNNNFEGPGGSMS